MGISQLAPVQICSFGPRSNDTHRCWNERQHRADPNGRCSKLGEVPRAPMPRRKRHSGFSASRSKMGNAGWWGTPAATRWGYRPAFLHFAWASRASKSACHDDATLRVVIVQGFAFAHHVHAHQLLPVVVPFARLARSRSSVPKRSCSLPKTPSSFVVVVEVVAHLQLAHRAAALDGEQLLADQARRWT